MIIDLISPYHGGSHRAWAEGVPLHSRHTFRLWGLPARFWKWRMHGGAVTLARRWLEQQQRGVPAPDLLLCTDMLDLTSFLALTRRRTAGIPTALYMHENQLTYPLPADGRTGPMRRQRGERDHHYSFINFASMLVADHIFFNSDYHRRSFFTALPLFLKQFPEYNELNSISRIQEKSSVLPVGIDLQRLQPATSPADPSAPPLILWNQRWEYDKNPRAFFAALFAVAEAGIPFRLALCGEVFGRQPPIFSTARTKLQRQLVHVGFAPLPTYRRLLWEAAVTISTARHEFFGISLLEAIYCRTFPLLPRRLSYPELIPEPYHGRCFYDTPAELVARLQQRLLDPSPAAETAALATAAAAYDWPALAARYDREFEAVASPEG